MSLREDVDAKRREISSNNLSMSVGELLNLYKDGELDIHPEFQRVFRWTDEQKSRLIESLLLGIPLPSIYVATNKTGIWEVVDGVQRLSTIFEFMGELLVPSEDDSGKLTPKPALTLQGTKYLPTLGGVTFATMDQTLRLEFKRTRLDLKILGRESESAPSGKFDLFERLNTYGAVLSPQELRNCILVSLNPSLFSWMKQIAEDEHFRACTLLSDSQLLERYDMDLALRFLTLRNVNPAQIGDVHDLLRDKMEDMAADTLFDRTSEEGTFRAVFSFLDERMDGNAFRPWNAKLQVVRGAFSLGAFEGFGLAMGRHWASIAPVKDKFDVEGVIHRLWSTDEYRKSFSGLRARERMQRVVPVGEKIVVAEINRIQPAGASRKAPTVRPKRKATRAQ